MALIACKECGRQISDSANACPHCGKLTANGEWLQEQQSHRTCPECGGRGYRDIYIDGVLQRMEHGTADAFRCFRFGGKGWTY